VKKSEEEEGEGVRTSTPWHLLLPILVCACVLGRPVCVWGQSEAKAAAKPEQPSTAKAQSTADEKWEVLFDGKSLAGWKRTEFGGGGDASVEGGVFVVDQGEELSGVNWTRAFPKMNYEVELEAQRRTGLDFFCALTFPVNERFVTFVVGGWGGSTVGISSVNRKDASQNETSTIRHFKDNRWYKIRVKVEQESIQAWIDEERVVDLDIRGKELDLRTGEIDLSVPLGIATFRTTAAFKDVLFHRISGK
jgi:hypothetical protein